MEQKDVNYRLTLTDLLSGKLREADGEAEKLETRLTGVQSMIRAAFAAAATYGVGSFVSSMIEAGTKVEDARVGLGTLLKDTEAAGQVIQNTMEDATKTPFAFEGLLAANKALIGAGENAENSRRNVLNLANAIAATGGGDDELNRMVVNLQQIKNVGEATAMDIKQFAMAGVNIYQVLADATGKPIDKVKEMKVSYELLTDALAKAHETGGIYEGGLEKMAGNTSVQISNLGDAMFQLKVKMFDDLKPAITWFISNIGQATNVLREGWDWMVKNKDEVKAVAFGVAAAATAYVTYAGAMKVAAWWQGALNTKGIVGIMINEALLGWELARAEGMGVMTAAQWALNAAMEANPIGIIVTGIAALGAILYYAWEKSEMFRGGVMAMWGVVKAAVGLMIESFQGLWNVMAGIATFDMDQIKKGLNQYADIVTNGYKKIGAAAVDGYNEGVASKRAEDANGKTTKKVAQPGTKNSPVTSPTTSDATSASKATGTKSVTITININKLIDKFEINANKITESYGKIQEHVANAILQAANDASLHSEI
jgi:tape measure domain-containing protein